jgi:type III restriction enzyme
MSGADARPPVFIIVCKNTRIAKVVYEWLADDVCPTGIPSAKLEHFRNRDGQAYTIRVDSKVVEETDALEGAKGGEARWMRFTLDTVGRRAWPTDRQGRPMYLEGFEALTEKLGRPLAPPGRDVRCIVSVGMLTEGWDCNTVAHIIGLRPFMSQLLCEQVVGRGLRRASYETDDEGKFGEEVAKVLGVPFEVIPFKANRMAAPPPRVKRHHVHALPNKAELEIRFPRVEGYHQAIRNRLSVDWARAPELVIEPGRIPPEVEVKGLSLNNQGRLSLSGPGRVDDVTLRAFRAGRRMQELAFDMARSFTREYARQGEVDLPPHVLFPQLVPIITRYIDEKVRAVPPADKKDLFLSPWYGWLIEQLRGVIGGDAAADAAPEAPIYDETRGPGSTAEVSFWTSREDVCEANKSHVNYIVPDTQRWEQSAAFYIDRHPAVRAFVKNAGLGFAIPYLHNGEQHDYVPDFIIRLIGDAERYLILETKGYDPLENVKRAAAERWAKAVTADGKFGTWAYAVARRPDDVGARIDQSGLAGPS